MKVNGHNLTIHKGNGAGVNLAAKGSQATKGVGNGSAPNLAKTGLKGSGKPAGLRDAASSVGKAVGKPTFAKSKANSPTGAGSGNKLGSANAAMKRYGR